MPEKSLKGLKIMVTAGPTRERLDPVRYISNFSSGKMGYAIAESARKLGAEVFLLSGPVSLPVPEGVSVVRFESALELLDAAQKYAPQCDIVIQAAAPADYRPERIERTKIKKRQGVGLTLNMVENPDIAAAIGQSKRADQVFVAFAAETGDLSANAADKMRRKNVDFIVANDVTKPGAGFDVDTNIATIITRDGELDLPIMSKSDLADIIVSKAADMLGR